MLILKNNGLFLLFLVMSISSFAQEMKIYHNWFVSEKYEREAIFEKYHFDTNIASPEYDKHKQWIRQSGFLTTPTILVNGYKLPENYKIEDLKFITKFNVINYCKSVVQ